MARISTCKIWSNSFLNQTITDRHHTESHAIKSNAHLRVGTINQTIRIMKKVNINVKELEKFDLFHNCIYYEDVWDDVFGAQEWTDDISDAVGFIGHTPVWSSALENYMSFVPIKYSDDTSQGRENLQNIANNILRSIEFCIARVICCEDEPRGTIASITRDDELCCFEHEDGIVVAINIKYDENQIDVFFYCK